MGVGGWLRLKYYQWELSSAAYMLEPWEKFLFNFGILLLLIAWGFSAVRYGPAWLSSVGDVVSTQIPLLSFGSAQST